MLKARVRFATLMFFPCLLLLTPDWATGEPVVDWVRVYPYYQSVSGACICKNGSLRMQVGDSVVALMPNGDSEWNLSWEEDNSLVTVARTFDADCGACFIDRVADDHKLLLVYKYDSAQTFLWETELKLSDQFNGLIKLATDSARNTYVVCDEKRNLSDPNTIQSIEIFQIGPDGKIKWKALDNRGLATAQRPMDTRPWLRTPLAHVDSAGVVTVVISDSQGFRTFRYNAKGKLLWDQTSDPLGCTGAASDGPVRSIEGLPDGDVVLTNDWGEIRYNADGVCDTLFTYPVIRITNRAAQEYFAEQSGTRADGYMHSNLRAFDERGNLYVAWNYPQEWAGDSYIELSKYDQNFNQVWSKTYGENDGKAQSVTGITAGGSDIVLSGRCFDQLGITDALILIYNEYGNLVLDKRYDSPEHVADQITSARADNRGNIYIYGISAGASGGGGSAVFLLKLKEQ